MSQDLIENVKHRGGAHMSADGVCEIVLTAPDEEWLTAFADALIDEHLIAGAHIIPAIQTLYVWGGIKHHETEARAALHTARARVPDVLARIATDHPYEVPGVFVIPATVETPYAKWIIAQVHNNDAQ